MLDGLPFMPEMLVLCGHHFIVDKRAEKICDTIYYPSSRRLPDTVLLQDLRCNGSGHDGCQAECRLFWKEAWLRRVKPGAPQRQYAQSETSTLATLIADASRRKDNPATYVCQATELFRATQRVRSWDLRAYVREYASGNVGLGRFLRVLSHAVIEEVRLKLGRRPAVMLPGAVTRSAPSAGLDLRPGELVRVRSKSEIAATLTPQGTNRGLWFDGDEMLPFSGQTYRVRQRVSRFIDDRSAKMIELKSDCVTLDGVICSGDRSTRRWFCPREIYPYWREAWLERVTHE
jgi:hypothetical protein